MKKLVFLIAVFFASCTTVKEFSRQDVPTLLDFRPYTAKNFIITTETYTGNYEPVGVVSYKIIPASSFAESNYSTTGNWHCDIIKSSVLIDSLYVMCNNLGANAIMNFWFKIGDSNTGNIRDYYTISAGGFAIIRK